MSSHATDRAVPGLDPDLAALMDELNARAPSAGAETTAGDMRAGFGGLMQLLHPGGAMPFAGEITEEVVATADADVRIRRYRPDSDTSDRRVLIFAHGGGWVVGDLDSADHHVRTIASRLGVEVVSVDYRLSPEHPFPLPLQDVIAIHDWVATTSGARWIALAGDSAGANLAAAAAVDAAAVGRRCDAQLLFYPALDPEMSSQSHREFGAGYLLDHPTIAFYWHSYLRYWKESGASARPANSRIDPRRADDEVLAGVAPVVLTTAGFDPLQDEGRSYVERLRSVGVPVTHLHQPALIHGWVDQCDVVPVAQEALEYALTAFAGLVDRAVSDRS